MILLDNYYFLSSILRLRDETFSHTLMYEPRQQHKLIVLLISKRKKNNKKIIFSTFQSMISAN